MKPDAKYVSKPIRDIPIRSKTGVSIMAICRGGTICYDPEPDFIIYPEDRLIIMGTPVGIKEAEKVLNQKDTKIEQKDSAAERFTIEEIKVSDNSKLHGKTVSEIRFRQSFGVTLIGIKRKDLRITLIKPEEVIQSNDILVVIGTNSEISNLKGKEPL